MLNATTPIRLVIADHFAFFRHGLKAALNNYANMRLQTVGEAANGKELIRIVGEHRPDIVLTDIHMPLMNGIEATRQIARISDATSVIALTDHTEHRAINDMFAAGAKGYLPKNASGEEIAGAIHTVRNGAIYHYDTTSSTAPVYNKNEIDNPDGLCATEINIVRLICRQLTTKEIAGALRLSVRSVENYSRSIKEKTASKNIVGIALYAVMHSIVLASEL